MATTFTRRAGLARVFRARFAAPITPDVRFLVDLFLDVLFLAVLLRAVLFLVGAPPFRAVAVLRLREPTPRERVVALFFVAVLLLLVLAERFLVDAALFAVERDRPVLFVRALFLAPARPADVRPADFARAPARDDFRVVAILPLLVSR